MGHATPAFSAVYSMVRRHYRMNLLARGRVTRPVHRYRFSTVKGPRSHIGVFRLHLCSLTMFAGLFFVASYHSTTTRDNEDLFPWYPRVTNFYHTKVYRFARFFRYQHDYHVGTIQDLSLAAHHGVLHYANTTGLSNVRYDTTQAMGTVTNYRFTCNGRAFCVNLPPTISSRSTIIILHARDSFGQLDMRVRTFVPVRISYELIRIYRAFS